jgi:hypothetical protein
LYKITKDSFGKEQVDILKVEDALTEEEIIEILGKEKAEKYFNEGINYVGFWHPGNGPYINIKINLKRKDGTKYIQYFSEGATFPMKKWDWLQKCLRTAGLRFTELNYKPILEFKV